MSQPVQELNLTKYQGTWYDIASIPKDFSKGCMKSNAKYVLQGNNTISVVDSCKVDNNMTKVVRLTAYPRGKVTKNEQGDVILSPAKLGVKFLWFLSEGSYWVYNIDKDDYQWAVVGSSDKKSLWILSRKPTMDNELLNELLTKAKAEGFPTDRVVKTLQ